MDAYQNDGAFPQWASQGKYFRGPVRSHYRPRSTLPALFFGFWYYFSMPYIGNILVTKLGTWGIVGAFVIFTTGTTHCQTRPSFELVSFNFRRLSNIRLVF